jgi:hypothetical protein
MVVLHEPVETCWDCGAKVGEPCLDLCDVACCLVTGRQRLSCGEDHDCGRYVFTGWWPGVRECREFGWYIDNVPGFDGPTEDLNRLAIAAAYGEIRWDREAQRYRMVDQDCGGNCTCCDADCGECCCCSGTCPPAKTGTGYCLACGWQPPG